MSVAIWASAIFTTQSLRPAHQSLLLCLSQAMTRRVAASDVVPDADLRPINADAVFSASLGTKCGYDCSKSHVVVDDVDCHVFDLSFQGRWPVKHCDGLVNHPPVTVSETNQAIVLRSTHTNSTIRWTNRSPFRYQWFPGTARIRRTQRSRRRLRRW